MLGLLTNFAQSILLDSWDYTTHGNVGVHAMAFVIGALCGVIVLLYIRYKQQAASIQRALDAAVSLASLDSTLLWLAAELPSAVNLDEGLDRILKLFLGNCVDVFQGNVSRAVIYFPDGEYLAPRVTLNMTVTNKFYVGKDPEKRRGVAGHTFCARRITITHFDETKEGWPADNPEWVAPPNPRKYRPYKSLASVPIVDDKDGCRGVLCFDSMHPQAFDASNAVEFLGGLGARIGAILALYDCLKEQQIARVSGAVRPPTRLDDAARRSRKRSW